MHAYFIKSNPPIPKEFWRVYRLLYKATTSIPILSTTGTAAYTNVQKVEFVNSFSSHVSIDFIIYWTVLITCTPVLAIFSMSYYAKNKLC